jgi:hypothetical protein
MQHGSLRITSGHGVGLEPMLRALARELAAGREVALDLQLTTAELIARVGDARCDAFLRLQALDRLTQTLGDLAAFTDALAGAAPPGWEIDGWAAARGLRLRDLAVRLATGDASCGAVPSDPGSEDDFLL